MNPEHASWLRRAQAAAALFITLILIGLAAPAAAQSNPLARIVIPSSDQSIRGSITVQGTANSSQFVRFEIAYAAEPDLAAWTVIGGGTQPVDNGVLAVWNTRPVADGNYALRVQVVNADGSVSEGFVRNLKTTNAADQAAPDSPAAAPDAAGQPDETATGAGGVADTTESEADFDLAVIPPAFVRGARIALLAFAALGAYVLLKRLVGFAWRRWFAKPVDYGR